LKRSVILSSERCERFNSALVSLTLTDYFNILIYLDFTGA
jgi:hypothetical protein